MVDLKNESLVVTQHCLERFMQRAKWGPKASGDLTRAASKILEMLEKATPVKLKPKYRASMIMKHNFKASTFKRFANWIFVIDEEGQRVVTCYSSSELRFTDAKVESSQ